jgi:hypothetical protein
MECEVIYTDEFEAWWDNLTESEQNDVAICVTVLESKGVTLGSPLSSAIKGSKYAMRELRIQHAGRPYRVLYVFDPERNAVLLIGGDKTGNNRWYEIYVPRAERIYEAYLAEDKENKS